MDKTASGRAGELALALYALVTADGEVELFTPVADDDHVDAVAGRRGGLPKLAIQVKTATHLDRNGLVEAKASYPAGRVREHPDFVYAVVLLDSVAIGAAWLIPSPDLNRLAYRRPEKGREILEFRASPRRADNFTPFAVAPGELGLRLLALIDAAPRAPSPSWLAGVLSAVREGGLPQAR